MKPTNNIEKLLAIKGNSINEAAKSIGITGPYLRMLINGDRNLSHKWMEKIAAYLECKPEDLIKDNLVININKNQTNQPTQTYRIDDNQNLYDNDGKKIITIPLYDAQASAGLGTQMMFRPDLKMQVMLDFFIKMTGLKITEQDVRAGRYCFIEVVGDSMSPFVENNNIVLIDTESITIEQYKQVMIFKDGDDEIYIKEVHKILGGKISIISYNPNYKSWPELTQKQYEDEFDGNVHILGSVVWVCSSAAYLKQNGGIKV